MFQIHTEHSSSTPESEHHDELPISKHVSKRLEALPYIENGYEVYTSTNLAGALDKLASSPFVSFNVPGTRWDWDFPIRVNLKGQESSIYRIACRITGRAEAREAGTWMNPDVSVFKKHATPSPFGGRVEETNMDPYYSQLKPDDLIFSLPYASVIQDIKCDVVAAMFIGKEVQIKLHKLAIIGEGGHFDLHRDSTHSDAHHGIVLFALNTEWEGGDLMLRRGDVEVKLDIHPTTIRTSSDNKLKPVVVAFYADTEYKVMPVTKGVQLVLQYDVEVVGEASHYYSPLEQAARRYKRLHASHFTTYPNVDSILIQTVIDEIRKLHDQGTNIVGFPLAHLYRTAKVRKEYLKETDFALFDALKAHFDIFVNPVIINSDYECGCIAYSYTVSQTKTDLEESDSEDGSYACRSGGNKVIKGASFHLPYASAILQITMESFGEHDECERIEPKYCGIGMFVKPKNRRHDTHV
ncbi:hypothetical protein K503DRAFT_504053 [Rhizopogon vinicolor AM-OR11-026]|uniref:Fe2OG dioxygenase domain-containing protein n=1 Tax=Rhizopogon vinicolor AM-OR11-026 TaxID=1314800 RepID=A0A1B7MM81_9AGAM|nr:hypothetical protein K503DRAFT_504053 [Rhizopogon vinicolor AM-OR11-026]